MDRMDLENEHAQKERVSCRSAFANLMWFAEREEETGRNLKFLCKIVNEVLTLVVTIFISH